MKQQIYFHPIFYSKRDIIAALSAIKLAARTYVIAFFRNKKLLRNEGHAPTPLYFLKRIMRPASMKIVGSNPALVIGT
jgi:hypothetical protein